MNYILFCHKIYKHNRILWCCCHQLQLLCLLYSACSLCLHEFWKCQYVTTKYSFVHATFKVAWPPEVITKKEMFWFKRSVANLKANLQTWSSSGYPLHRNIQCWNSEITWCSFL